MALTQVRSRAMGLKELRMKRGLTQRELAEKVGISYGRIGDYEQGRYTVGGMSLDLAIKFCDALRVANPRKLLDSDETSAD